jgi:hypothetical protein
MAAIYTERTARKPHQCTFCLGYVKPGERYVSAVLPPHDNDIGNHGWWRLASHGAKPTDCPERA